MIRSRLKIRFHKTRPDENWLLYKTQRNLCMKLLRKTKKDGGELTRNKNQTKKSGVSQ